MPHDDPRSQPPTEDHASGDGGKRPWSPPVLEELPPLTDLTLQTGDAVPGDGDTGDGGSTVF